MASTPCEVTEGMALLVRLRKQRTVLSLLEKPETATISVGALNDGISESLSFAPGEPHHEMAAKNSYECVKQAIEVTLVRLKELGIDPDAK